MEDVCIQHSFHNSNTVTENNNNNKTDEVQFPVPHEPMEVTVKKTALQAESQTKQHAISQDNEGPVQASNAGRDAQGCGTGTAQSKENVLF